MVHVIVWPGWLGGVLIGLILLALAWVTGKPLGCSTAYANMCGLVSRLQFFRRAAAESWRLGFVLGIPLGGLLAGLTSPEPWQLGASMGALYDSVMPASRWLTAAIAAAGGVLIGFGARLAGGCQSGHSIMGMALLNPASAVASAGFFAGGIVAVQVLFQLGG